MVRSTHSPLVLASYLRRIDLKPLKRLAILGSTGSIGQSTLSIVEQFPDRYSVATLAAGRNLDEALAQTVRWRPKMVSLATEELAARLEIRLRDAGVSGIEVVQQLRQKNTAIDLDMLILSPEAMKTAVLDGTVDALLMTPNWNFAERSSPRFTWRYCRRFFLPATQLSLEVPSLSSSSRSALSSSELQKIMQIIVTLSKDW